MNTEVDHITAQFHDSCETHTGPFWAFDAYAGDVLVADNWRIQRWLHNESSGWNRGPLPLPQFHEDHRQAWIINVGWDDLGKFEDLSRLILGLAELWPEVPVTVLPTITDPAPDGPQPRRGG